jgi:hypothetical protein
LRTIAFIISVFVLWTSVSSNVFALSFKNMDTSSIHIFVDDEIMEFATQPFIEKGTIMVPFRAIFEKLGLEVGWDSTTSSVTGTKEGLSIILQVGNNKASVNGVSKTLLVAPKNVNGSVFIPLRFVGENAERDVVWDSYWREAVIADEKGQIERLLYKHNFHLSYEDPEGLLYGLLPDSNAYRYANQSIIPYEFEQDLSHEDNIILNIETIGDGALVKSVKNVVDMDGVQPLAITYIDYWLFKNQKTNSWSISEMRTKWTSYRLVLLKERIHVSADLQAAIIELATNRAAALTAEDSQILTSLYEKDTVITDSHTYNFETTDITHTLFEVEFISSIEDEVLISMTVVEKNPNPYYTESVNRGVQYYVTCKKGENSQWLIASEEIVMSINIWE